MQGAPLNNKHHRGAGEFREIARRLFEAASQQKKTQIDELENIDLASIKGLKINLTLRESPGRFSAMDGVLLHGVHFYGEAFEFFILGLACWTISRHGEFKATYAIQITNLHVGVISTISVRVLSSKNDTNENIRQLWVRCIRYSRQPFVGFGCTEKNRPSFGVIEHDKSSVDQRTDAELLLQQSLKGLNALGRCLMTFASMPLSDLEEIHFEQAHLNSVSSIRRISYEAGFYKVGSFAGDSIFGNY